MTTGTDYIVEMGALEIQIRDLIGRGKYWDLSARDVEVLLGIIDNLRSDLKATEGLAEGVLSIPCPNCYGSGPPGGNYPGDPRPCPGCGGTKIHGRATEILLEYEARREGRTPR